MYRNFTPPGNFIVYVLEVTGIRCPSCDPRRCWSGPSTAWGLTSRPLPLPERMLATASTLSEEAAAASAAVAVGGAAPGDSILIATSYGAESLVAKAFEAPVRRRGVPSHLGRRLAGLREGLVRARADIALTAFIIYLSDRAASGLTQSLFGLLLCQELTLVVFSPFSPVPGFGIINYARSGDVGLERRQPFGAPCARRNLRADQAPQDHAGVRQHPQPGRIHVPGAVAR